MRGLIISVGGSPAGQAYSICDSEAEAVVFFASKESKDKVDEIKTKVEKAGSCWPKLAEIIITPDPNSLEECYNSLAKAIPDWLERNQLNAQDVVVDYTGGMKSMIAALVLFCVGRFHKFVYVSGYERDKEGLGNVKSGSEYLVLTSNPYSITLGNALMRWRRYIDLARCEAAAEEAHEFEQALDDDYWKFICATIHEMYDAIAKYDKFAPLTDYKAQFFRRLKLFRSFCVGQRRECVSKWLRDFEALGSHIEALSEGEKEWNREWIYALIANAIRRAEAERKYEDAVARLYASFERLVKLEVYSHFKENTSKFPLNKVPGSLKDKFAKYIDDDGKTLKIPLAAAMGLLKSAGSPVANEYFGDESIWNKSGESPLQRRNHSILAHGYNAVQEKDYLTFKKHLFDLWSIDENKLPRIPQIPNF